MAVSSKNWKELQLKPAYSLGEEIANSVTHGVATGLSIAGLTLLVMLASLYGDVWQIVSFSIYGGSLILLYLASTLYHSFPHPKVKRVFKSIDHASIYLLIAGTYTPFLLVGIRGLMGWILFTIIWTLAIAGVGFKIFFVYRFSKFSTIAYVLMGWLAVFAAGELIARVPVGGIVWLILGGVAYTVGVIFYLWKKLPYHHAIWHLFVMLGSLCHFFAILFYLTPTVLK